MPDVAVSPGRNPEVCAPWVDVAQPMSVEPPLKKRPTWNAETTVEPLAKVSGSTSVACWLEVLWNGSLLIFVSATFAAAVPARASTPAVVRPPISPQLNLRLKILMLGTLIPTSIAGAGRRGPGQTGRCIRHRPEIQVPLSTAKGGARRSARRRDQISDRTRWLACWALERNSP